MPEPSRVCLFTGVSGTLGRDFASRFADVYELVGVYHSTPPGTPFVSLESAEAREPGTIFGVRADLRVDGAVDELLERVLARFESVDLLVNAAVHRQFGEIGDRQFVESLPWQFFLNVCVPAELASALVNRSWCHSPRQNDDRGRNIVNLSSTAGHRIYQGAGQSGYGAGKAALDLLTRHFAVELGKLGVRANAVAPDTFPHRVSTESVSEAVRRYDRSDRSGEILVIDAEGEHLLG